ncbi:MAG: heme ABC transporter permease CcmB [Chloroflexaceae bacterium]|nr:heme ABC transporter permease CcmB [Chloroflexaceae bacterium]
MKLLFQATWAVLRKDLRSELRTRYALNALLLFAVSAATAVSLGVGPLGSGSIAVSVQAALLWVALLFAALNGLARSFVQEEERRTSLALRLTAPPLAVYLGKLLFNLVLLALLDLVTTLLFLVFVRVSIGNIGLFIALLLLGSVSLVTATTLIAAIIARASFKSGLFAVLAFPLLVPVLVVVIQGTALALRGDPWSAGLPMLQLLLAYIVVTFVASSMLFPVVWEA